MALPCQSSVPHGATEGEAPCTVCVCVCWCGATLWARSGACAELSVRSPNRTCTHTHTPRTARHSVRSYPEAHVLWSHARWGGDAGGGSSGGSQPACDRQQPRCSTIGELPFVVAADSSRPSVVSGKRTVAVPGLFCLQLRPWGDGGTDFAHSARRLVQLICGEHVCMFFCTCWTYLRDGAVGTRGVLRAGETVKSSCPKRSHRSAARTDAHCLLPDASVIDMGHWPTVAMQRARMYMHVHMQLYMPCRCICTCTCKCMCT